MYLPNATPNLLENDEQNILQSPFEHLLEESNEYHKD